eukprot:COSAG02_NODE_7122_length_3171_cov_26.451823_3_plen_374_part_00
MPRSAVDMDHLLHDPVSASPKTPFTTVVWSRAVTIVVGVAVLSAVLTGIAVDRYKTAECAHSRSVAPPHVAPPHVVPISRNVRPQIGVLVQPTYGEYKRGGHMFLPGSVVNWVRGAGAQVIPVPYDANQTHLRAIFNTLSGLFFPPGAAGPVQLTGRYVDAAKFLFQLALDRNNNGSHFPLFGVCWGYELLTIFAARDLESTTILTPTDAFNLTIALDLQLAASKSRLFQSLSEESYSLIASTVPIAENMHTLGVRPDVYTKSKQLGSTLQVLTTSEDRKGSIFVSVSSSNLAARASVVSTCCAQRVWVALGIVCDHAVLLYRIDCRGARWSSVLWICLASRTPRVGMESIRGCSSRARYYTLDDRDCAFSCP